MRKCISHSSTLHQQSRSRQVSRRKFIATSIASGGIVVAAPGFLRGRNVNDKLNVAIIGCGGRGRVNLSEVAGKNVDQERLGENITAICDVDENILNETADKFPRAQTFTDFRRLFDKQSLFDAVVISTCNHTHAFATLPALQLGKHVYCEKPLAHSIWETRIIRDAASKAKVATQVGTQIHASDNFRQVVELLQTNAIGPVREVHVWTERAWGWHGSPQEGERQSDIVARHKRTQRSSPVPAGLNWDLWLGPALERPFSDDYLPGPKWYRWWDFGGGTLPDLGSHLNDLPFWALNLDLPHTVEAIGPSPHPDFAPASMRAIFDFRPRAGLPAVRLFWYQGTYKPEMLLHGEIPKWANGVLFVGTDGMLLSDYGKHVLLPEERFKGFVRPDPSIPRSIGHHMEWIRACKTDRSTTCNFDYAARITETNHLGNIAYRIGKKLQWSADQASATNAPEAQQYIRREYRDGWSLG